MFVICDVQDVGCGIFKMSDIQEVACFGCGIFEM